MSYKTEMHCHSKEFSWCSNHAGAEKAEMYIEAGYSTVVLTNHFCPYYPEHKEHDSFVRKFFDAAEVMRSAAGDRLHVLTGMELCFSGCANDYLVYGMTEEKLLGLPNIIYLGLTEFFKWADKNDVLVIQAHPLRPGMTVKNPRYLHGIEVFNGSLGDHHPPHCNDAAAAYADVFDRYNTSGKPLIRTSGSDHHNKGAVVNGGIETDAPICTMDELVAVLRSGEYSLIRG